MVHIETTSSIDSFRIFLINSTCLSFIPESYFNDRDIFPEKEGDTGSIYIEAADKVTLKKIRMITFISAKDILGIIYISKSGNTNLKWRQTRGKYGKVSGEASANSLVNLLDSRVITKEYAEELAKISISDTRDIPAVNEEEEEDDFFNQDDLDVSKLEVPGLEGTLQSSDDV